LPAACYQDGGDTLVAAALPDAARHDADARLPRVALPSYPFQRRRFWFDDPPATAVPAPAGPVPEDGDGDGDRDQALLRLVIVQVANVLGLDPAEGVDTQQSLQEMGVTSLAAIELTTQLEMELGVLLPASLTVEDRTIAGVVTWLREHLDGLRPED
jgi:acyl carrier protein